MALRTKERTAVGGGAGRTSQGIPGGDRLPVAPRERKPALAALAVLLILVGALGATVLVLRAGDKVEAIEITQRVAAGQPIPASAVSEVDVSKDGFDYVMWSQRDLLGSYRAATDLLPNTPLVGEMLTHNKALATGQVVVGLSLKDGQYPQGLQPGDHVAAYQVGTDNSAAATGATGKSALNGNLLTANAKVQSVVQPSGDAIGSGDLPVTLVVGQSDAAALTQAASAGEVALVVVPTGSGG